MSTDYTNEWMNKLITQINTDNGVGGGTPGSICVRGGVGGWMIDQMTSDTGSQTHVVDAYLSMRETCLVLEGMVAMKTTQQRAAKLLTSR